MLQAHTMQKTFFESFLLKFEDVVSPNGLVAPKGQHHQQFYLEYREYLVKKPFQTTLWERKSFWSRNKVMANVRSEIAELIELIKEAFRAANE